MPPSRLIAALAAHYRQLPPESCERLADQIDQAIRAGIDKAQRDQVDLETLEFSTITIGALPWVCQQLIKLRRQKGLSQVKVAAAMDWSLSKQVRWENGNVTIGQHDLRALLSFYGVTDQRQINRFVKAAQELRTLRRTQS